MYIQYDFDTVKKAVTFNTTEVLPSDNDALDKELHRIVEAANKSGEKIRHYIGFEISGKIHFPGSVYQMLTVARLQKAGIEVCIWLADYHTWINKKLDGNIKTIRKVAKEYFEPVLRKSLDIAGGNGSKLVVLYAKDEYFRKTDKDLSFWDYEFEVDKHLSLNRVLRSLSITGKEAGTNIDYQVTRYPGMQAADVFWLQTHIVQSGLDQRKIYVSCRDIAYKMSDDFQLKIGDKNIKPITIFNNLLLGMTPPKIKKVNGEITELEANKMSKSKPDSAIWVHDNEEEMLRKLKKAYCPMPQEDQDADQIKQEQQNNPLLDWSKKMIFPAGKKLEVIRPDKFGGNKTYDNYKDLELDYFEGRLHAMDLKSAIAKCFSQWFAPIREWADSNSQIIEFIEKVGHQK